MRTRLIRSLSISAFAFLVLVGNAVAQDKSSAVLNTLEVQQLVKQAGPGDNARLAAHFAALEESYVAEAKRHTAMSQSFVGNPSRSLGTGMTAHCKRLADLNSQSAAELHELAAYHQNMAAGAAPRHPSGGASFEGGAGAAVPTDQELNAMAAKASTPADHHALEDYFLTLAKRDTANANKHVAMAQTYRGSRIAVAAVHCDRLVTLSRDSAKEATAAAAMHHQLAGVAR